MAKFDIDGVIREMGKAALPHLKAGGEKAKLFGKAEADKMARTAIMLATGVAKGTISKQEARLILEVQRNASRSVLLTIKGLGIVSVENATNAAMDVLRQAVEVAVGIVL